MQEFKFNIIISWSCFANDNDIDEMIVIASDGVGCSDGTAWGGNTLLILKVLKD